MIIWISAGANSAVAAKLALCAHPDATLIRIWMPDEDPDNDRFCADIARWLGHDIITVASLWRSVEDVARARRYISGVNGAPCTLEMKKSVRHYVERWFNCAHRQAFGFTIEERARFERLRAATPEVEIVAPLIEAGLTGEDCRALLARAGIALPRAYHIGLEHNNCIGCFKSGSRRYWATIKRAYPDVFARRAALERDIGYTFLRRADGAPEPLSEANLDEIPLHDAPPPSCSLFCHLIEEGRQ